MRIAYIGIKGLPPRWGADRVVEAIVQRLASRHEITVYCSGREIPPGTNYPGVRLVRVPCLPGKIMHMVSVNLISALHAVLIDKYDLIHLHNIEASFVLPLLRMRYKVVTTAHGRITPGNKWGKLAAGAMRMLEYPFACWSTFATSVSEKDANEISKERRHKILHIPNGIDINPEIDEESVEKIMAEKGVVANQYIIFVAGRIIPLKGAHLLLSAYSRMQSQNKMLVVGDLSQSPEYAIHIKDLADPRVIFSPFVSSSSILLGLMKHSILLVFPSLSEGMSMTLLEAASIGTPILCSDIPANMAVLSEHALHFSSGSVDDLSAKLQWALVHKQEMGDLGTQAQSLVRNKYSWDYIVKQYENLYQQVRGTVQENNFRVGNNEIEASQAANSGKMRVP
jgi:glycosyltransferase involved in cell wall biosynthesis